MADAVRIIAGVAVLAVFACFLEADALILSPFPEVLLHL